MSPRYGDGWIGLLSSTVAGSEGMLGTRTACTPADTALFVPRDRAESPTSAAQRHVQALELCGRCPGLTACRSFAQQRPAAWTGWVIGGRVMAPAKTRAKEPA